MLAHRSLRRVQQPGEAASEKPLRFSACAQVALSSDLRSFSRMVSAGGEILDLRQEPRIDAPVRRWMSSSAHAAAEGIEQIPDALGDRRRPVASRSLRGRSMSSRRSHRRRLPGRAGPCAATSAGAADGHDFADRLHLRRQARIGGRELLEGEARDLGDDVVDRRLERGPGRPPVMSFFSSSSV